DRTNERTHADDSHSAAQSGDGFAQACDAVLCILARAPAFLLHLANGAEYFLEAFRGQAYADVRLLRHCYGLLAAAMLKGLPAAIRGAVIRGQLRVFFGVGTSQ